MLQSQALLPRPTHRRVSQILFVTAALLVLSISPGRVQAQGRFMEELRKTNEAVGELIRSVTPSVVQILVTGYGPQEDSEQSNTGVIIGRQRAIGSGFIVDPSGYIITNAHVVNGAQRVQVVLTSASLDDSVDAILSSKTILVPARIIGVTREIDLALLKVDVPNLPTLKLQFTGTCGKANRYLLSGARKDCAIR
jgi:S1-C subfamily serine protease